MLTSSSIEARHLTKRYGSVTAVDDISFIVQPGTVTGFLGRNGAGKSTTMRMIVGLHRPTSGTATVTGHPYRDLAAPLRSIGVLLDARAVHPGLTARAHLTNLATADGIATSRVNEVLQLAAIGHAADRPVGTFSLGMGQRLGIAGALLGNPPIIMLDEPLNGLDPDGILWVRHLMRSLAEEGRTVFFSSHLMTEMALVANRLIILDNGHLIADTALDDLLQQHSSTAVDVHVDNFAEHAALLSALARVPAARCEINADGTIIVRGSNAAEIGRQARAAGVALTGLRTRTDSLEEVFMKITGHTSETGRSAG